ncbi:isoprenylcysteine carboxylmethyltransferase family protein [Cardiobacterium sp. AH-315-I02]|nr:isoprenylcysteine carboxylmethyltransferase family protein [Cardiobacterium sp. AH-315-I02]
MRFFVFFYCLFQFISAYAADINLAITQTSKNNQVAITVTNHSHQPVEIKQLELILNNKNYVITQPDIVLSGQKKNYDFTIQMPDIAGSYAQQINLYYLNDAKVFTLTDIGFFYYKKPFNPPTLDTLYVDGAQTGLLNLKSSHTEKWRIVLPREVTSRLIQSAKNETRKYWIRGNYSGFNNNYPVFAVSEGIINNRHYAQILRANLQVRHAQDNQQRGWTSNFVLLFIILLSLLSFVVALTQYLSNSRYANNILAYSSRLFWLSLIYYLLKNSPLFFAGSAAYLEQLSWGSSQGIDWINLLYGFSDYLNGKNYSYFFRYFIDAYLWAFVFLYPIYLHFSEPQNPEKDKYIRCLHWTIHPLCTLLSRANISIKEFNSTPSDNSQSSEWQSPVKKGFLILAVKLFFLPLLASWVIGNVIHQWNLLQAFEWTFHQMNAFILALLILTDTSIFLSGYMFESHHARNQIRSVEPTILGWLVCLWCYPPFNQYSFNIFDYQLFSIHININSWAEPIVLTSITLLWGVFVWASFTLKLKASNLTNRGTVSHGPYRYCRHPAYTAKIMIWAIEAIFLGKYFIGLLIGFAIIYFLRAWTEERHLAMDKDYRSYQQQVPYRFIPGVY